MEINKPKFTYYHKMLMATFVMSVITGVLGILTSLFIGLELRSDNPGNPTAFVCLLSASLVAWIVLAIITAIKTKDNKLLKLTYFIGVGIMAFITALVISCGYASFNLKSKVVLLSIALIIYLGGFIYISILGLLNIKKTKQNS